MGTVGSKGRQPLTAQALTPEVKSKYIRSEIPAVSWVRKVFKACGKKLLVVRAAAVKPNHWALSLTTPLERAVSDVR